MYGYCVCMNIELRWQLTDLCHVPRACQCSYCASKGAAYVSNPGSALEAIILNDSCYATVQHGSMSAVFHECTNCDTVVFVTAEIDGELYGALNANCFTNKLGFSTPVPTDFSTESAGQKRERWRKNWCAPVRITVQG